MEMTMKVNRKALVEFFDTNKKSNKSHSSSINAVCGEDLAIGLLKHYFAAKAKICTNLSANPQIGVPKEEKKGGGRWLDGWLLVQDKKESPGDLYQVEIKSWSAHSLGGKELALDVGEEQLNKFKAWYWSNRWNGEGKLFKEGSVNKVLLDMRKPVGHGGDIKRLVCFWAALSPNPGDGEDYFFKVMAKLGDKEEMEVHVFSLSGYLRTLTEEILDLDLPKITQRLGVLGAIFPDTPAHTGDIAADQ